MGRARARYIVLGLTKSQSRAPRVTRSVANAREARGTRNGDYRTVRSTVVRMPSLPPECLLVAAHASSLTPTPAARAPLAHPGGRPETLELSRTALPSLPLAVLAAYPVQPRRVPRPSLSRSALEFIFADVSSSVCARSARHLFEPRRHAYARDRSRAPRISRTSLCEKTSWIYVALCGPIKYASSLDLDRGISSISTSISPLIRRVAGGGGLSFGGEEDESFIFI